LVLAAQKVLHDATGQEPVLVRLGATVPITAIFREMLGVQTLMFGFNLPDEDVHAPNEFFHIASLGQGLSAWPQLLEELGKFDCDEFRSMAAEAESTNSRELGQSAVARFPTCGPTKRWPSRRLRSAAVYPPAP
jgi:hypothetical protein